MKTGATCVLAIGHRGKHRRAEYVERSRERHRVANLSPEQHAKRKERNARWNATLSRWEASRRSRLRGERERILEQLDALHREEEQWRTRSDTTTQTR